MALITVLVPAAFGQDDYKKWEFYGGYSALFFDTLAGDSGNAALNEVLGEKQNLRGLNLSLTRNFHKYVGVKFDWSLGVREDNFTRPNGSGTVDSSVSNYLGGIQIKDNSADGPRFKPFAHALFGMATQKVDIDSAQLGTIFGFSDYSVTETSFAMAFGGGIDIKLNDRIDIRVVQADWNIINRGDQQIPRTTPPGGNFVLPGTRQDNFRIGAGIVIH